MIDIKPYNALEIDDRWKAVLADYDGFDPGTGAYLRSSKGYRKFGRPKKYYAKYLNFTVRFTASTLEEATNKANTKLNEMLSQEYQHSLR